jgi:hypothetical protein
MVLEPNANPLVAGTPNGMVVLVLVAAKLSVLPNEKLPNADDEDDDDEDEEAEDDDDDAANGLAKDEPNGVEANGSDENEPKADDDDDDDDDEAEEDEEVPNPPNPPNDELEPELDDVPNEKPPLDGNA